MRHAGHSKNATVWTSNQQLNCKLRLLSEKMARLGVEQPARLNSFVRLNIGLGGGQLVDVDGVVVGMENGPKESLWTVRFLSPLPASVITQAPSATSGAQQSPPASRRRRAPPPVRLRPRQEQTSAELNLELVGLYRDCLRAVR